MKTNHIQRARCTCARAGGAAGGADTCPAARSTSRGGSTRRSSRRGRCRPRRHPRRPRPPSSAALTAHRNRAPAPPPLRKRTRTGMLNLQQQQVACDFFLSNYRYNYVTQKRIDKRK